MDQILSQDFFARDALVLARDLLGKLIVINNSIFRITETEAYRWPHDSANHCYKGKTMRNAPMFGPPGHAYIYLCYGLHQMFNIVSNKEDEGAAVLIRSCEQHFGHSIVSLAGPGKVGKALGIDKSYNGHALYSGRGLKVLDGPAVEGILVGPRVGIDYAETKDRLAPYRFADQSSLSVTKKAKLLNIENDTLGGADKLRTNT